jgi:predicted regulator of Ras-like GTPase activity (Roadblock/LC7/MglB family)
LTKAVVSSLAESCDVDERERLRKKLDSYPSPSSYNRLAELERLSGNMDEATELCLRCIHEFPRNGQAYVILAGIHLSTDRRDMAHDILERGVKQDRRSYSGLRMLSDLYADAGQYSRSIDCLQQILTFKRNDESVRRRLEEVNRVRQERGESGPVPESGTAHRRRSATPQPVSGTGPVVAGSQSDNGAIDLSSVPVELATSRPRPTPPTPAAIPEAKPVESGSNGVLNAVCSEHGVRGAVVVDEQGRLLVSQGLPAGRDELLAALATDVTSAAGDALSHAGHQPLQTWAIATAAEQILLFKRDSPLTLLMTAAPDAKLALLELRARQALIELGSPA